MSSKETNTKLEKQTIERLIKETDPPLIINYNYESNKFVAVKKKDEEYEVEIYGCGDSLFDALIDLKMNQEMYFEFIHSNYDSAEDFIKDPPKEDDDDIIDRLRNLTSEEQI